MRRTTAEKHWAMLTLEAALFLLFLLALSFLLGTLSGCGLFRAHDLPAPCDTLTLDELKAKCHREVRAECERDAHDKVDEKCPKLRECDQRIRDWLACEPDGGAR